MISDYEQLIALAKSAKRVGVIEGAIYGSATNASCGDACDVSLVIEDGKIVDAKYEAKGCVISRAAAAVLVETVIGPIRPIGLMTGETMRELLAVPVSPLRERCLTTALAAVQNAISKYESRG
jgi:NifU-like protein involved in Fe-S cluster formation